MFYLFLVCYTCPDYLMQNRNLRTSTQLVSFPFPNPLLNRNLLKRKLQFNPNVTVRMRGVMEKCTYCVQRIEEGKIAVKREGRALKDGDIKSACQQACPTQTIAFGDLNDPESKVAKWEAVNRNYKLLAEIGTRPRTSFLARIRNPNPKLKGKG